MPKVYAWKRSKFYLQLQTESSILFHTLLELLPVEPLATVFVAVIFWCEFLDLKMRVRKTLFLAVNLADADNMLRLRSDKLTGRLRQTAPAYKIRRRDIFENTENNTISLSVALTLVMFLISQRPCKSQALTVLQNGNFCKQI